MNRWIVRSAVALASVVATVVTAVPGPALAAKPVWRPIACFSGAIRSALVTGEAPVVLTLQGYLDCSARRQPATFGYARYDTDDEWGVLRLTNVDRYQQTPPTLFSRARYVEDGPVNFAICVVTDLAVKIGCVQVQRADWTSKPEVTPLPAKDPAYGRPFRIMDGDYRPPCGSCW